MGRQYARTLDTYGSIQQEPRTGKRASIFIFALMKDILVAQAIIWLTLPILSLIGSHVLVNPNTLNVNETIGAILLPLAAVILAVRRNLRMGKWYWAILNVCLFVLITFSTKIPASVPDAYHMSVNSYIIEACAGPVVIVFLIGNWKRLLGGGLGCAVSCVLWWNLAYDFLAISFGGLLPIVSSHAHVITLSYDLVLVIWSACGLEAIILVALAGMYIVGEVSGGIDYVVAGTRSLGEAKEKKEKARRTPGSDEYNDVFQQQRSNPTTPDVSTIFEPQAQDDWKHWIGQALQTGNTVLLNGSLGALLFRLGIPEEEAKEAAFKLSENLSKGSTLFRDLGNWWNQHILHTQKQKETPEDQAWRKFLEGYHTLVNAQQKQKKS